MRVAVLGYGGIARRHLDLLQEMDFGEPLDVMVVRARSIPLNEEHGWAQLSQEMAVVLDFAPHCAIVASPASEHVRQAQALADIGTNLLIEKPLALDLSGVDRLIETARDNGLTLMVGYNMAFHNALSVFIEEVQAGKFGHLLAAQANVGQYLPDWRPHLDYRSSVSADASLGGGVIMELSHELEYVDRLIGGTAEIFCFSGSSGLLDIDVEDCADIMMKSPQGVVAHIHMDMLQKEPFRACLVSGSAGSASLDILRAAAERSKMYRDQLAHFFKCVKGQAVPLVPGSRGRRIVELILAAKESAEKGRRVKV